MLDLFGFLELFKVANIEAPDGRSRLRCALMRVRRQPSVLEGLTCSLAPLRSADQLADEVLRLRCNIVPLLSIVVENATCDHLQDLLIVVTVEGRVSAEQNVKHAACRPHVAGDVVVAGEHLRGDVVGCACARLHTMQLAALHDLRETEVDNLKISIGIRAHKQEVLGLEISVHDVHRVAIVQGLQDLFEDLGSHLLAKEFFLDNPIEKFTACAQPIEQRDKGATRPRGQS